MAKTMPERSLESVEEAWTWFENGHDKTANLKMQEAIVFALVAIAQQLENVAYADGYRG